MTLVLPDARIANGLGIHERFVRSTLWLACFLLTSLTTAPFPNLGDPRLLDPIGDGNRFGQILVIVLTLALATFVLTRARWVVLRALTPALVLTLLWFAVTAVVSAYSGLALRRLLLAGFTVINATALLVLPIDREHFGRLLAIGALIILATSYLGVLLAPQLSIHQASDVIENALAGAWRGPFGHKNGAGSMMVVLIFVGIYVARTVNLMTGLIIMAGAAIFLAFTNVEVTDGAPPAGADPFLRGSVVARRRLKVRAGHRHGCHRQPSDGRDRCDRAGGQADHVADARCHLHGPG